MSEVENAEPRGMTTIDEIMVEVIESQDAALSWYLHTIPESELDAQVARVRALITQAIAGARADGAREMRGACEERVSALRRRLTGSTAKQVAGDCAASIRALPLPAKREPVRLTDAGIDSIRISEGSLWWSGDRWCCEDADWYPLIRAIETAVLAANGLTK